MAGFVEVEVEQGDGELLSLRWKAVEGPFAVTEVTLDGRRVAVEALGDDGAGGPADAAIVEDSSDGETLLVRGGSRGLRLTDRETGAETLEPYLLLARDTPRA